MKEIFLNVCEFLLQKFADFAYKLEDGLDYLVLRQIRSDSVLFGLKDTSQVSAQFEFLLRSAFRHSAAVSGSSTMINRLVSSANSLMFAPISLTMSLI